MHIALVSQEYPPETAHGGIATQTEIKARGLARLGHAVFVVSRSVDGRRSQRRVGGVEVVRIPGFDTQLPLQSDAARWLTDSALVAAEVAALHRSEGLDLVDFPDWGCEGLVHLLNRTPGDRPRAVIHLHGPLVMLARTIGWPEPGSALAQLGVAMESTCLRLADAIVSSSACSAGWVAREYGIDPRSMPVIHTGIDTRTFRPGVGQPDERPTIVFAGRVARSKGADTLVDAALALSARIPALRLRMIGRVDAAFRDALALHAARSGRPHLLEFAGHVPRGELPRELGRGHVFAAPSRYEGGPGFVNLEAMACGLPVVACAGSGAAEAVDDPRTGRLVPPGDERALAQALEPLLTDADLRQRVGRAARRRVQAEAESADCIGRYERFLCSVVAEPG